MTNNNNQLPCAPFLIIKKWYLAKGTKEARKFKSFSNRVLFFWFTIFLKVVKYSFGIYVFWGFCTWQILSRILCFCWSKFPYSNIGTPTGAHKIFWLKHFHVSFHFWIVKRPFFAYNWLEEFQVPYKIINWPIFHKLAHPKSYVLFAL